jgi:hypothetical protein
MGLHGERAAGLKRHHGLQYGAHMSHSTGGDHDR